MTRQILSFPTPDVLGQAVARDIARRLSSQPGPFLLGCPGGRSPRPVYQALARLARQEGLGLNRVVLVMMDEYLTPSGAMVDEAAHFSCRRFARHEILSVLNAGLPPERQVRPENLWFPDPAAPASYDKRIADAGGIALFLLASGAGDGHVAFNPPGSARNSGTRIVTLAEQTRLDNLATFPDFGSIDEVPRHGLTVGIATIAAARASAMLVWGADKRQAWPRLAEARAYDPTWPATVWVECPDATLYADTAAQGEPT